MKDLEEIIAKVIAKYDSQILYDIIAAACIYKCDDFSFPEEKLYDINITAINYLLNPSELPVNDYWSDDKSSYLVNDLSKYINFSNVEADEKKIIRQGLEYLVRLYRSKRNRIKITWRNTTSSQFVKNEFRNWLIEQEKKSIATVNNYLHGFDVAQSHHNEALSAGISFYDIDDIKTLQTIFSKYIDGEHSVIGKKYSGAVRSSLKAYLRFFQQRNIDNCDFPSDTSVPKAILHKKNGENIEIRGKR